MEIELTGEKKLLTVRIDGELDHHSAADIRARIDRELKRTGAVNVAFDFSNVEFMDSSGIGVIMGRYKIVKSLGGRVVIFGMSKEIERIVRMAGVQKIADIY